ncbi:MAG: hypothetical protein JWM44_1534 [Bacilli bacterium]|nr:hypothetical protein [Bacilli bacterium]
MINYNLKTESFKNHPMDDTYGVIVKDSIYTGYPVTIVDNHDEVVNGKYTHNPALCLLHLSEHVRQYVRLKLYDGFLYLSFFFAAPTYRMYPYDKVTLSKDEIIEQLKTVLYGLQPALQSHSLVGTSSKRLEDNPNYYDGCYVLNDEEEYSILKCRTTYKFFKGQKSYYPNWKDTDDLIFEGEINFDVYRVALEAARLRKFIVTSMNQILDDESNDAIARYKESIRKLKELKGPFVVYKGDTGHLDGLTNGKEYSVIGETESQYIVNNDLGSGSTSTIQKTKFDVVKTERI